MRSLAALATGLLLTGSISARIVVSSRDVELADSPTTTGSAVITWVHRLLDRTLLLKRQDATPADNTCVIDPYYTFVYNSSFGESVCRALLTYPNQTTTTDYTPISTVTTTFTTRVQTQTSIVRETQYTTVTVTANLAEKRGASITPAARNVHLADVFNDFRRQNAPADDTGPDAMSASFSSACRCQTYQGSTITVTYTAEPSFVTVSAFKQAVTTVVETRTAALATTTTTVTPAVLSNTDTASSAPAIPASNPPAAPSSDPALGPSSTLDGSASEEPAGPSDNPAIPSTSTSTAPQIEPTAPIFSCPEDDGYVVSQLLGSERYDYLIRCDTEVTDPNFYDALNYATFSECAAACSKANYRMRSPVCGGISFYDDVNEQGYNCVLKRSSNNTVPALGVNSGLLQRVAVGLSNDDPAGTNTESAPFVTETPTANEAELSSSAASALGNSTTYIPVTAPPAPVLSGRQALAGTFYSTYVSNGQTYSTGSLFSTYFSSDGYWFYSYYTTYSVAWASATTVYAASETGISVANTTNSESTEDNGADGEHWTVTTTNTTTFYPGGYNVTQVISNVTYDQSGMVISSSATTNLYSYATEVAGGGSGGFGSRSDAGVITSTSPFSTFTVISTSAQTGAGSGSQASGVIPTLAPSMSGTTTRSTLGTAFSTGAEASGGAGGSGGGSGAAGSGAPLVLISSTVISTGLGGESGAAESGSLTPISSTVMSTGIGGESGTAGSGSIGSSSVPFTDSQRSRSGTYSTTTTVPTGTAPINTSTSSRAFSTATSGASSSRRSSVTPSSGVTYSTITSVAPGGKTYTETIAIPSDYTQPSSTSETPETSLSLFVSSGVTFTYTQDLRTRRSSSAGAGSPSQPIEVPGSSTETPGPNATPEISLSLSVSSGVTFTYTQDLRTRRSTTSQLQFSSRTVESGTRPIGPSGTTPSSSTLVNTQPTGPQTYPGGRPPTSGSSSAPFSNTDDNRTRPTSTTNSRSGTAATSPVTTFPPHPTGASSCVVNYLGTTTVFTTITEYGCYSNCAEFPGGQYDGPRTFGPPQGPDGF